MTLIGSIFNHLNKNTLGEKIRTSRISLSVTVFAGIQIPNSEKFLFQTKWIKMGEAEPTVQTSVEKIYKINTTDQIVQFIQSKIINSDTTPIQSRQVTVQYRGHLWHRWHCNNPRKTHFWDCCRLISVKTVFSNAVLPVSVR